MLADPVLGAGYLVRGLRLLRTPGVRRYVLGPLLINLVLFAALLWLAVDRFEALLAWAIPTLPDWLAWLHVVLWLAFAAAFGLLMLFGFTLVANLVGAPFNGLLSEAVERHLTGAPPRGSGRGLLSEVWSALTGELHKLLYFARWAIPLALLSLIPGLNLLAPVLWLFLGAWMLALEYADFPMGNHGLRFVEQRPRLARRRLLTLGFGGATLLWTAVPVLNFLVMPAAVAGATALWVEQLKEK